MVHNQTISYCIADLNFEVTVAEDCLRDAYGFLREYVSSNHVSDRQIYITSVEELEKPEGELVFQDQYTQVYNKHNKVISYSFSKEVKWKNVQSRMCRDKDQTAVQVKKSLFPNGIDTSFISQTLELGNLLSNNQGIILHSSFIEHKGKGILFTAPSGTGKSTQAALWEKYYGADLINGDRAAIRVQDGKINAWGIPFSGTSRINKNVKLPLAAIVYLSQAPFNQVTMLRGFKAFHKVWEGCSVHVWNKEDVANCSQTVTEIVSTVPIIHLECLPDRSACDVLHQTLKGLNAI